MLGTYAKNYAMTWKVCWEKYISISLIKNQNHQMQLHLVSFCYSHFGKYNLERTVVSLFYFRISELVIFKIKYCIHTRKANSTKDFLISFPSVWGSQNIMKNWLNIFDRLFKGCISSTVIHLRICGFFDFLVSVPKRNLRVCCLDL